MIPIRFDKRQVLNRSINGSPSPMKPAKVMKAWLDEFGDKLDVRSFHPLNKEFFYYVHDRDHVDAIFAGKKNNGFETRDLDVVETLRWTNGSFKRAVMEAYYEKLPVSVSPTSGFHHAGVKTATGYCTFNGLMLAAKTLLATEPNPKIGILDCDEHYGNGTDEIIWYMDLERSIHHYTYGGDKTANGFDSFIDKLPSILETFKDVEIIFYQAGADPHENDPYLLEGPALTTQQLYLRDQMVFRFAKENGIPIVWNLAGGYQEPLEKVLEVHSNTMRACIEVFGG